MISTIFLHTVYVSVILMLLFSVCSFPIAIFYGDRVYIPLGQLLSIALLFNALNMVPNGILNRNKKFVSIAVRTVVVYIGTAVITVFLAIKGLRYYALAIQAVLTAFFTFVWNYITTKPKFKFKFENKSIKKVIDYSGYQFAFNMVNYFSRNLDNLLTGKFMGKAELGYYNKAYTLMLYPVNNLTGVVSPVLHPILSDYQKQLGIIYGKYTKIVRLLACISIYVTAVCLLASNEIISILYGSRWKESIVCFSWLAIAITPQMINSSAGAIFQAIGNTKLLFINSCINTVITVVAILIGIFVGKNIQVLSMCVAIAYVLHFITAFGMLIKFGFKYKIITFIKNLLPEIFILLAMLISIYFYPSGIIDNILLSCLAKILYLGIVYIIVLLLTKEYRLFLSVFK